jgi:hypothetical protein
VPDWKSICMAILEGFASCDPMAYAYLANQRARSREPGRNADFDEVIDTRADRLPSGLAVRTNSRSHL